MLGSEYMVLDKTDIAPGCVELNSSEVQWQMPGDFNMNYDI